MLHLEDVRKVYRTGAFTQAALDGVTLTFRDNEFSTFCGSFAAFLAFVDDTSSIGGGQW
ncbi:MAG: hypothetical protein FWG47_00795 [Propionibacteriaceae bacterium]|nr:hypothetical protein [Propionibacteriaceae bacterium]